MPLGSLRFGTLGLTVSLGSASAADAAESCVSSALQATAWTAGLIYVLTLTLGITRRGLART